jgi:hypothetical protein
MAKGLGRVVDFEFSVGEWQDTAKLKPVALAKVRAGQWRSLALEDSLSWRSSLTAARQGRKFKTNASINDGGTRSSQGQVPHWFGVECDCR